MPCLNEEGPLPTCLGWAREALSQLERDHGLTGEILISDSGSTDGGVQLGEPAGARVVHCVRKGYGHALRFGVSKSRGRYIVMGDADGSYDFREGCAMVEKLM